MATALRENQPVRGVEAVTERPDGTRVPFMPYPTPLRDASGALTGAVNMLVDITERKQAEMRQKALIDELNHRVKNTLATVQSLAAQTLRGAGVPDGVRGDFEGRLFALSRTHDQLTRERWESADLRSIAEEIFASFREGGSDRIGLDGPRVKLAPQQALMLAMVLHELATNAAKYGCLCAPEGTLSVTWSIVANGAGPHLKLEWQERGGPPVQPPSRKGFGSRLLERGIIHELEGSTEVSFHPSGLHCAIDVPLRSPRA